MVSRQVPVRSPSLIVVLGGGLFAVALWHHAAELLAIGRLAGPLLAFLLDGSAALLLAYAGYRLGGTDLAPALQRTVFRWCLAGVAVVVSVVAVGLLVWLIEGRPIPEPTFLLLLAANVGGLAGVVAGYYNARAREQARRSERTADALALVNGVLRHDLRNDLNLIRGYADLLEDGAATDPATTIRGKADEALDRIESIGAIVESMIGDPELERVDLADVAAETVDAVELVHGVTVETDLPEEAPVVANAGLRSVVDNLVENAMEHTDAADPRIAVEVDPGVATVRLFVRDNGPGIPDEQKPLVFEADPDSPHGGGLHLVATLVDRYGGDVWVDDNEPCGAVFAVELRRADA